MKEFLIVVLAVGLAFFWKENKKSETALKDASKAAVSLKSQWEKEKAEEIQKRKAAETLSDTLRIQRDAEKNRSLYSSLRPFSLSSLSKSAPSVNLADFKQFAGQLNGFTATVSLRWVTPTTVVGMFVRNGDEFALAGDSSEEDQLFMSVAFKGRTVAHIKARKDGEGWTGSMRVEEDGSIMPFDLKPTSQDGKAVVFKNSTKRKATLVIGYFDSELNSWTTRGYYTINPSETCSLNLRTRNGTFYYRATLPNNYLWEGKQTFAIGAHDAFTIREADSRFPSFVGDAAKQNYDSGAETKRVGFRSASFENNSSETRITFTEK